MHVFFFCIVTHCSLYSFLEIKKVIIVLRKKCCTLRHPYRTRAGAKTKIISDIEQVQGKMKGDMKAMKEHMTMMMEVMISMRKMMDVNVVSIVAASASTERDLTHLPGFNQESHRRRRSRRHDGSQCIWTSLCLGPEQTFFSTIWFASQLYIAHCCICLW